MLSNAANFPLGHARVPNKIQEGGLAMVYMSQYRNNRSAGDQASLVTLFGGFRIFTGVRLVWFRHHGTYAESGRNQGGHLIVDDLVHSRHDSVAHQLLNDVYGILVGEFRQSLDGQGWRQYQNSGLPPPWLARSSFSSHLLLHRDWVYRRVPVISHYLILALR